MASDNKTIQQALDDGSGSGYVDPKRDCPHVKPFFTQPDQSKVKASAPCHACGSTKENWVCLTCYTVSCSRFQQGHGCKHYEETGHPIALSYSDLSIWCYECDTYIKHAAFQEVFHLAYKDKFGAAPGSYTGFTGAKTDEELKEYFDEASEIESKAKAVAQMIKESKHFVIYTGAGISTSAKIPDYRGPQGVWTLRDKGISPSFEISLEDAKPTYAHMALATLVKKGICKLVASTNVDGLHLRSGIPLQNLTELHGNIYKEHCKKCNENFYRTIDVTQSRNDHLTGRKCEKCKSPLYDTIINFGEDLPFSEVSVTVDHANLSDLSLVLGTSMRVGPANKFPDQARKNGGKMVIVNLQHTPYNDRAAIVCHARTDDFMRALMKELGIEAEEYSLDSDPVKGTGNAN
mmetsp:Transcript_39/g.37  ORF Transcript_39/g.37 Transcript_39/m.37 type:complete len:405 (-) Transcript_39:42-1256(-)|eukprot:CAMPEP_0168558270 /NCGR_PEP_ID=MMETSP0413-20121227/9880_1 /TAXON_ID=136452 /ORGANISM="Filamoeba nolandi, Strain NC-AS-23-1" /LENGTH=404 /DNA_ID=CAMNT_0008589379 /DNA_START=55 /DNA_END=1269 /DNA_ORIENTATION=+